MTVDFRLVKTEGIVLRRTDLLEADRLFTIFTQRQGKVRAVAKGVRRPGSKKAGHLEPFGETRLMLSRSGCFWLLTQANSSRPNLRTRSSLLEIAYASVISEILDRISEEDVADLQMYQLLSSTLKRVETSDDPVTVQWTKESPAHRRVWPGADHLRRLPNPYSAGGPVLLATRWWRSLQGMWPIA